MSRPRFAIIGCGHLGSIHARLANSIEDIDLVAVVDPERVARQRVAAECGCAAVAHHREIVDDLDGAIIATPTIYHHEVALDLLEHDVHLLVEKPITSNVLQANELIGAARRKELVLQVGHVERFNPAWNAVLPYLESPQFIEVVRAGTYTFRATDVSIVLDLMIHDLDLVLSLVNSPIVDVEAIGVALFGPHEDLAMARLKFANGCIANLKASRVNYEPQRTMQIYARSAFAAIDFALGQAKLIRPSREVLAKEVDLTHCPSEQQKKIQEAMFKELLCMEEVAVDRVNAILQEQQEFVDAVRFAHPVRVTGEQGRDALAVAEQILEAIDAHHWNGLAPDQIGAHAIFAPHVTPTRRAA